MARLVDRLLLTPEVLGSSLVLGKFDIICILLTVLKSENKTKRCLEWPIYKTC